MPRAPKPRDQRQNRETRDVGEAETQLAAESALLEIPRPPAGLLRPTKASWERYWRSPARAALVASLDIDTLERLWILYDERLRAQRELRKGRVVEGSQGQMRPSGFYTVIARLDAEIRQLEDRVAKTMKSRLLLGMVVSDGRRPVDDSDDEEPEREHRGAEAGDEPAFDPRLYVVGGNAR